jgi:hypothetical protein
MDTRNNVLDIDKKYKNRLLVADYTTLDSKLPSDGLIDNISPPALETSRDNSKQWIDIFVNFGIKTIRLFPYSDTPVMETDSTGLDTIQLLLCNHLGPHQYRFQGLFGLMEVTNTSLKRVSA